MRKIKMYAKRIVTTIVLGVVMISSAGAVPVNAATVRDHHVVTAQALKVNAQVNPEAVFSKVKTIRVKPKTTSVSSVVSAASSAVKKVTATSNSKKPAITTAMIQSVCNKYGYKAGKYWTYCGAGNKNKYTASAYPVGTKSYKGYTYAGGSQCWAFARYLMTQVTGVSVGSGKWKKISASSVTSLKVGDVVSIGDTKHTAVVYKDLGGGKFQFLEVWGSYGNKIVIGTYNGSGKNTLAGIKSLGLKYIYRYG